MPLVDGSHAAPRPRMLVHAAPQKWADFLRVAEPFWEIDWVSSDDMFALELARRQHAVAICEQPAAFQAASSVPSTASPVPFLKLSTEPPEFSPHGVEDYLACLHPGTSPSDLLQWLQVARDVSHLTEERSRLQRRLSLRRSPLIGNTAPIERLRLQVAGAALHDWPVLIQGEAGTGRDLVATAIHEASDRAHRPLLRINCRVHTALSLERELFGAAATRQQPLATAGRLELADGGVVVLDGIDEISLPLQAMLAKVLEQKCFQRIGDNREIVLTARIVGIASRDLSRAVLTGDFRDDLLRHFGGPVLTPPPLRDIRPDIGLLTEHLLHKVANRLGESPRRLLLETLQRLQAHQWPGNVRELEQLLERVCTTQQGSKLTPEMVDAWLMTRHDAVELLPGLTLAQMERQLIEATFARCAGNRELTAQTLQIGLRTLSGKLREYGYPPRGGPGSNQLSRGREAA